MECVKCIISRGSGGYIVYYTPKIDHTDQDRCLYMYSIWNINGYELVLEAAGCHLVSCILEFCILIIPVMMIQWLV